MAFKMQPMTPKQFVKQHMPKAKSERHKENGGRVYWLIRDGNNYMYFSSGETETKAWSDAKDRIVDEKRPGLKVTYIGNPHKGPEKGIIKSIPQDQNYRFVVFNCAGNWENYQNYTAAKCHISELKMGWE